MQLFIEGEDLVFEESNKVYFLEDGLEMLYQFVKRNFHYAVCEFSGLPDMDNEFLLMHDMAFVDEFIHLFVES